MNDERFDLHTLYGIEGKAYSRGVWEVDVELIEDWLDETDPDTFDQVLAAIRLLADHGPGLGRPLVDSIAESRHKNMKELRPGSAGRSEVRILFAFDPKRRAIMILAGDKHGAWQKWYRKNIRIADDRYDEHLKRLKEQKGGKRDGKDA